MSPTQSRPSMNAHGSPATHSAIASVLACILASRSVMAQPSQSDLANRIQLLQAAQQAAAAGQHQQALELAGRANRILRSTPSLRMVAEEQAALDMIVESIGTASECAHQALLDPASPARDANAQRCAEVSTRMQGRAGQVFIETPTPLPAGMTITIAGKDLSSAFWGVNYLVNPGSVEIIAQAPGFKTFTHTFEIASGAYPTIVNIEMERQATVIKPVEPPPSHDAHEAVFQTRERLHPVGPVLIGVGAAALASAAALHWGVAEPAYSFVRESCQGANICTRALTNDAVGAGTNADIGAIASLIVGVAAGVAGGVLTAKVHTTERVEISPGVSVDGTQRSLFLRGTF